MRTYLISLVVVVGLSLLATFATYLIVGPPDRSVPCDPGELEEWFVCLADVRQWEAGDIVWVDARPKEDWEVNGVEGAIHFGDDTVPVDGEEAVIVAVSEREASKVVVYCNQSGCGSSKYVAGRLRPVAEAFEDFQVFVLEGGYKALKAERLGF